MAGLLPGATLMVVRESWSKKRSKCTLWNLSVSPAWASKRTYWSDKKRGPKSSGRKRVGPVNFSSIMHWWGFRCLFQTKVIACLKCPTSSGCQSSTRNIPDYLHYYMKTKKHCFESSQLTKSSLVRGWKWTFTLFHPGLQNYTNSQVGQICTAFVCWLFWVCEPQKWFLTPQRLKCNNQAPTSKSPATC